MDRRKIKLIAAAIMVLVLALAASACGPGAPEGSTDAPPEVEEAAVTVLSEQTGISADEMEVVDAEPAEWPDACLGLGQPDEGCAEVLTPGWALTIEAQGETYNVRTDDLGLLVRVE